MTAAAASASRPSSLYPARVESAGPLRPRLRVGVIGTGRVGAVLGAALRRTGHDVVACSAGSDISRVRAEALLPGVPIRPAREIPPACDLLLLTVPDDALPDVVGALAPVVPPGQIAMHASGRYGIDVLSPLVGALPIAAHPVMTFTGTSLDLERLEDCPFGVTTTDMGRPIAAALVMEMGGDPVWVDEVARTSYHAALAHGANHLVTLVAQTIEVLGAAGVEDPARLVRPLLTAALDNALREGDRALTGPVARGDSVTVSAHLGDLREVSPETHAAYVALARATVERAVMSETLSPARAQAVRSVLLEHEAQILGEARQGQLGRPAGPGS